MEEQVKKYIVDHKNPMRFEKPGTKLYLRGSTVEELELCEKNNLAQVLWYSRVERRCARAQAIWCADKKMANITKVTKGLVDNFGYQDRNGIFLYPEEMLFLVEANKLEVTQEDIPFTIQECYDLVLNSGKCNLRKYLAYKKLVLHGYRLVTYQETVRHQSKLLKENDNKKRKVNEVEDIKLDNESKIQKSDETPNTTRKLELDIIKDIFEKMREKAPKTYESVHSQNTIFDYEVFVPHNKTKNRANCDFYLIVCDDILSAVCDDQNKPIIYAVCVENNISFYRLSPVKIPFL